MDVSVVILSWNDKCYLQECLQSLISTTKSHRLEIIVVSNASTDGTPEMVAALFPQVKLIRNQENVGFAKGNNIGVKASQGKYVCLLNSDIKILDGCLDALVDYLEQHPRVGMIGPKILNGDLTHQSSCRQFPTLWNNLCEATGLARAFRESRWLSGEHMFYFRGDLLMEVEVLVGCFWVIRRAALDEFGLLDEGFFMFAEDLDWCKRCQEAGWRVVFYPGSQAIHYRGGSSTKRDPLWLALTQQQSILRYWHKHHGSLGRLSMRCLFLGHLIIRWGAAGLKYLLQSERREEMKARMQLARACLGALVTDRPVERV